VDGVEWLPEPGPKGGGSGRGTPGGALPPLPLRDTRRPSELAGAPQRAGTAAAALLRPRGSAGGVGRRRRGVPASRRPCAALPLYDRPPPLPRADPPAPPARATLAAVYALFRRKWLYTILAGFINFLIPFVGAARESGSGAGGGADGVAGAAGPAAAADAAAALPSPHTDLALLPPHPPTPPQT
jgi:hypothetical protein